MKTLTVGELKAQFSEVLDQIIKNGKPVAISYGKKKEKIAAIVPYNHVAPKMARPLGPLKGRAKCIIHDDFSLSDEGVLQA
ncbi:MAG: type II toxin-antitoxin system Phd/YefM family antitoxin [Pseudomonadales bacterium]|jgi:antitoxin (DNA-binding transcriptional repressor) of toxin-antitoxin stability system|nr:type II toxin-antitoxin system Phd/YefM family antitoxin [Pseudomonadales bacterium]